MKWVIGLMSGTSLDGVDIALIKTDGETIAEFGPHMTYPFDAAFKDSVKSVFGQTEGFEEAEKLVTHRHIQAVERFLQVEQIARDDVALIGFHGQTVFHDPAQGLTIQLGDGAEMAKATGIAAVNDFRSQDVAAGGQGAPLVPVFHQALCKDMDKPVCVLNLGGVGNVTYIGEGDELLAFDTGPANALVDDWVHKHLGLDCDEDGQIAASGEIHDDCVNSFITHPYFERPAPKSLDRDAFKEFAFSLVDDLSVEDGAATLSAFTVASVMKAQELLPDWPQRWIICGGGRLNKSMMSAFNAYIPSLVQTAEQVGWSGDAIEAQAFAYLAARAERGLPLTFQGTTGVRAPQIGGRFNERKKG